VGEVDWVRVSCVNNACSAISLPCHSQDAPSVGEVRISQRRPAGHSSYPSPAGHQEGVRSSAHERAERRGVPAPTIKSPSSGRAPSDPHSRDVRDAQHRGDVPRRSGLPAAPAGVSVGAERPEQLPFECAAGQHVQYV